MFADSTSPSDDPTESADGVNLLPLVYSELRRLARSRMAKVPPGNTLQPTELVHEAYMRLVRGGSGGWDSPGHFFAAAAEAMRRILVEQARRKASVKHGGHLERVDAAAIEIEFTEPAEDVLALNEAVKRLGEEDPRKARIVLLRIFAGLTREETAAALDVSVSTIDREWRFIIARLHRELFGRTDSPKS
ncbi:MAG: sigma-70 family RNA polymerase sigma factor [Candidatus Eisenbacteria bacterium]|nr:sigma-70 family RNA polymerase sigma factor [Candidatus Eisenbacteria bacterium]